MEDKRHAHPRANRAQTLQIELHVLAPDALEACASNVPGSREMLTLAPAALYARRVIVENNEFKGKAGAGRFLKRGTFAGK